jgi:hypothetical protein
MRKSKAVARFVVAVLVVLLAVGCGRNEAKAEAHAPTSIERQGLALGVRSWARGPAPMKSIAVSTVNRAWASVVVPNQRPPAVLLFHRRGGRWDVAYLVSGKPIWGLYQPEGVCAYAPAGVVRDLYRIKCPPWRALHARKATKRETQALLKAFVEVAPKLRLPPGIRTHYEIVDACISRLDSSWASGLDMFGGSVGQAQWFHRQGGRWHWERPPPHAIALSFAACG